MPPILIAILLVTVFVVDELTAVEASTVPVAAGSVSVSFVVVPATLISVAEPEPLAGLIVRGIYTTTQLLPLLTSTVTPLLIVIGPNEPAFVDDGTV